MSVVLSLEPATVMPPHLHHNEILTHSPAIQNAVGFTETEALRHVDAPLVAVGDDAQQKALAGLKKRVLKNGRQKTAPHDRSVNGHVCVHGVLRPPIIGDNATNPSAGVSGLNGAGRRSQDATRALLYPVEGFAMSGLHAH
jgi:hypothetical protein